MLKIPLTYDEMYEATLEAVRRNNIREAYIRIVVSRGVGDLGLDPIKCPMPTIIIIVDNISLFPQVLYDNGLEVITAATRQRRHDTLEHRVKSLNYLNNILVKLEAAQAGLLEAIVLSPEGYVVEGSGSNIFIVDKKGILITPPVHVGALEGITRNTVMDLAAEQGLTVKESLFTRHDLYTAKECFLTGTAAELIPVISVDRRSVGDRIPGSVTKLLIEKYRFYAQNNGTKVL
jgi:branched-chain amino acid aminotransferase